jgi:asparagine synthetase B (glutamine-hydrolysing)
MATALVHRPCDDTDVYIDPDCTLSLPARRSIVDVAGGHQPIDGEGSAVWAIPNDEASNHKLGAG